LTTPDGPVTVADGGDGSRIETPPNSVALLLGGPEVPVWFGLAVEEMCVRTGVTVTDVTIATPSGDERTDIRDAFQRLLVTVQDAVIMSNLDREIDVRLFPSVPREAVGRATARPLDGVGVTLPGDATERIAAAADVVVHHGVGILQGDLLQRPEFGVLGYHHGDIRHYRGPGYGFWEYMHDEPESGVTLQVLNERLDEGEIVEIVPVDISDAHTLAEIRRRLNAASVPLLADGIERLREPTFEPERLPADELGEMYYYADATVPVKLRYALKEGTARLRHGRLPV
jgi:hypothetical protein